MYRISINTSASVRDGQYLHTVVLPMYSDKYMESVTYTLFRKRSIKHSMFNNHRVGFFLYKCVIYVVVRATVCIYRVVVRDGRLQNVWKRVALYRKNFT